MLNQGVLSVRPAVDEAHLLPLPSGYGKNRVTLMVRDPRCAYAYWEIDSDRIRTANARIGGGSAFLRLVDPSNGRAFAHFEIRAERGQHWMELPRPDRAYRADLALVGEGGSVVLARSNVVHAPPEQPRPFGSPVFVGRSEQQDALRQGQSLSYRGAANRQGLSSYPYWSTATPSMWLLWPGASEARLFGIGSELRLTGVGSEGRLLRSNSLRRPVATARVLRTPARMARATNALAGAIKGGDQVAAHAAADSLATAMVAAGTPVGVAVIVLSEPTGTVHGSAGPRHDASRNNSDSQNSQNTNDGWTTVNNPDGSVTVTDPSGATMTLGPASFVSDGQSSFAAAVGTPSGVAAVGSALSAGTAATAGGLGTLTGSAAAAGEGGGFLASMLGAAETLGWALSAGFGLLAVLLPGTANAPELPQIQPPVETPDGTVFSPTDGQTFTNPDGSVTVVAPDGTTVTLGPATFDDGTTTTQNPDGSVTITGADGTSVTVGPATFDSSANTTNNADGSVTFTSPDGSSVTVGPATFGDPGDSGTGAEGGPGPGPGPGPEPGPEPSPEPSPEPGPEPDPEPGPDPDPIQIQVLNLDQKRSWPHRDPGVWAEN